MIQNLNIILMYRNIDELPQCLDIIKQNVHEFTWAQSWDFIKKNVKEDMCAGSIFG